MSRKVGGKTHQRGGKVWNQNRQRVGDKTRDVANMQSGGGAGCKETGDRRGFSGEKVRYEAFVKLTARVLIRDSATKSQINIIIKSVINTESFYSGGRISTWVRDMQHIRKTHTCAQTDRHTHTHTHQDVNQANTMLFYLHSFSQCSTGSKRKAKQ